jgi:hypothetical protein
MVLIIKLLVAIISAAPALAELPPPLVPPVAVTVKVAEATVPEDKVTFP